LWEIPGAGAKFYVADKKGFIEFRGVRREQKGELKMQVHPTMLLKTNVEKIPAGFNPRYL
jgi:hypothetical protein